MGYLSHITYTMKSYSTHVSQYGCSFLKSLCVGAKRKKKVEELIAEYRQRSLLYEVSVFLKLSTSVPI